LKGKEKTVRNRKENWNHKESPRIDGDSRHLLTVFKISQETDLQEFLGLKNHIGLLSFWKFQRICQRSQISREESRWIIWYSKSLWNQKEFMSVQRISTFCICPENRKEFLKGWKETSLRTLTHWNVIKEFERTSKGLWKITSKEFQNGMEADPTYILSVEWFQMNHIFTRFETVGHWFTTAK